MNTININVLGGYQGFFSCLSNAAAQQQVTISKGGATQVTFSGTGEGVPMADPDGNTTWPYPQAPSSQLFTATFMHNSGAGWQPSQVVGPLQILNYYPLSAQIAFAEDATDNDYNDTILLVISGVPNDVLRLHDEWKAGQ